MDISLDTGGIVAFMLVSLRLAVVMFATPMDAFGKVPTQVRLFWTLGFGFLLTAGMERGTIQAAYALANATDLAVAALHEVMIGSMLAFGLYTAFGAVQLAGRLMDFQAGFGAATLFDPTTNEQAPLLGTLLVMLAAVVFFTTGMHHLMLKGIMYSFEVRPVGNTLATLALSDVVRQFGQMFTLGIMVAAPVIGILMLVDAGVAIMSKSMPQMNVYFLFLPLKALLCFLALVWVLPLLRPLMLAVLEDSFIFWQNLL